MLEVTSAQYIAGYKIRIEFNTGEAGIVDLAGALWGPVFEPLRDTETFKRFTLSSTLHTITWENEADLAPEYLYAGMIEQAEAMAGTLPSEH